MAADNLALAIAEIGMVGNGIALSVDNKCEKESSLVDEKGKEYLHMSCEGEKSHDQAFIEHVLIDLVTESTRHTTTADRNAG
eukprot:snap_masked-scaffold2243_size18293-processed-gene-0.0 protein:Tk00663 transcript:snap_masked-scaffold2243_size18293-processed-gene-0.0-mRNA-1 annotation:"MULTISPECIES: hypothetical protein"